MIRDHPEALIDFLADEQATKERHAYYKNVFVPENTLEAAARWFYLNRTSYSGIMKLQNCFWGYGEKYSMRPENWPRNIRRTSDKLKDVKITCSSFEEVIITAPDGSFLFIDPPYFNADQDKFYTHSFVDSDHYKLCQLLKEQENRIRFLLTYDNSPAIREMYGWTIEMHDKEWNYTISRTDDQKKGRQKENNFKGERSKGREVFILNYDSNALQEELHQLAITF